MCQVVERERRQEMNSEEVGERVQTLASMR